MKTTHEFTYKGYNGKAEYIEDGDYWLGEVDLDEIPNVSGGILFQGDTFEELEKDFVLAVEDLIDMIKD